MACGYQFGLMAQLEAVDLAAGSSPLKFIVPLVLPRFYLIHSHPFFSPEAAQEPIICHPLDHSGSVALDSLPPPPFKSLLANPEQVEGLVRTRGQQHSFLLVESG